MTSGPAAQLQVEFEAGNMKDEESQKKKKTMSLTRSTFIGIHKQVTSLDDSSAL